MSADPTQASGTAPSDTTAQPGGSQATTTTQAPEVETLKAKLAKAEGDLGKIREFYTAYPDLVQFARKYTEDQNAAAMVRNYLNGKPMNSGGRATEQVDDVDDTLSSLDEKQRKAVERLLEQKLEGVTGPMKNQYQQLQQHVLTQQIEKWRGTYNKQNGWPVDFSAVENEVATLLQQGKANDAEAAYKLLAADHYRKSSSEQEKQIQELKRKTSMSRDSVPQSMPVRGKGERKTIAQSYEEALQVVGTVED